MTFLKIFIITMCAYSITMGGKNIYHLIPKKTTKNSLVKTSIINIIWGTVGMTTMNFIFNPTNGLFPVTPTLFWVCKILFILNVVTGFGAMIFYIFKAEAD